MNSKHALNDAPLYGREEATRDLQQAFQDSRAQQKPHRVVWVKGQRGCGKTALVQKSLEDLVKQERGYFVRGRYDEMLSAQPFSGLVDALTDLCDYLLEDEQIGVLRVKLSDALGSDAPILTAALPQLSKLTGYSAPSVAINCKPEWTFERLKIAMRAFIQTICGCNIPVVLFLDDLHFGDEESLELLKCLALEPNIKYFLFVGAYCDELLRTARSSLFQAIAQHAETNPETARIMKISNLTLADVKKFLSGISNEQLSNGDDFASFLYGKTNGNPQFLVLLLRTLLGSRFRRLSLESESWQWDLDQIKKECFHVTPIDFITDKVNRHLAEGVREVLTISACIGSHFSLNAVAMTVDTRARDLDVEGALEEATDAGLLSEDPIRGYRFPSDDIRRIVYHQVPESSERSLLHLSIGYQLYGRQEVEKESDTRIMLLINRQLNMGAGVVTEAKGRNDIARMNVSAAKIAKQKSAFKYALECLQNGLDLMSTEGNKWEQNYQLSVEIAELFMELFYTTKDYTSCLMWVNELLRHAQSLEDKLQAFAFQVEALAAQGSIAEALSAALCSLDQLGERLSTDPPQWQIRKELATTRFLVRNKRDDTLLGLPIMANSKGLTALSLLWRVVDFCSSSRVMNLKLLELAAIRQMKLALREGLVSGYAFSVFGRVLGSHRYILDACRFADLSLQRMNISDPADHVSTLTTTTLFLSHLQSPWQECIDPLLEAHRIGMRFGEIHFASLAAFSAVQVAIFAGLPLHVVEQTIERTKDDIEAFGRQDTIDCFKICQQYMLNLSGESSDPLILSGLAMNEATFVANAAGPPIQQFHLFKLLLAVYFQNEVGMESASNALLKEGMSVETTHISSIPRLFFLAVAAYRLGRIRGERRYERRARRLTKELEKLTKPNNVSTMHFLYILNAEHAGIRQRPLHDIKRACDDAIEASVKSGFVGHVALANELAGEHFDSRKDTKLAKLYFTKCDDAYRSWGANAKIRRVLGDLSGIEL